MHPCTAVDLRRVLLRDDVDAHVSNASTRRLWVIVWCHASSAQGLRNHPRRRGGQAIDALDGGSGQARGAVRRAVSADRLRDIEPHQLGAAADRRADAVQVAQPRPAHLADVADVAAARLVRRLGARAAAPRQALVLGVGGRDPAEPQPRQRREARHRRRHRRRPRLSHGLPPDAGRAHRLGRARHGRRHPPADLAREPVRRHRRRPDAPRQDQRLPREAAEPDGARGLARRGARVDGQLHLRHRRPDRGGRGRWRASRRRTTTWAATSCRTSSVAARPASTT